MNDAHDELSPPPEAPVSLGDQRPPAENSIKAAQATLENMIEERPADAAPDPTRAASAAPAAPQPGPELPPPTTPEGRILRNYVTVADVEAVRDRLTGDEYHDLHATAVIQDRERGRFATERQQQLDRLAERVPEVADPESRRVFTNTLTEYVRQFDYAPQELLSVTDSRAIELARHGLKQTERVRELEQELAKFRAGTHPMQRNEGAESQASPKRGPSASRTVELPSRLGVRAAAALLARANW
jgi:hypothetical protein